MPCLWFYSVSLIRHEITLIIKSHVAILNLISVDIKKNSSSG